MTVNVESTRFNINKQSMKIFSNDGGYNTLPAKYNKHIINMHKYSDSGLLQLFFFKYYGW